MSGSTTDTERVVMPRFPHVAGWEDRLRPALSVAVVPLAFLTTQPLGLQGHGLLNLILLVVNSLILLISLVPDRLVRPDVRFATILLGIPASAAMLASASTGVAVAFPYFLAGHLGYRYPARRAVPLAVAVSICTAGALAIAQDAGITTWPWAVGLFTGFPVLIGSARRSRVETIRNAHIAVAEAERAAKSEAREQALAERAGIARDIHDVLAHSLSGVNMQLEMADALLERERIPQAREAVNRAQSMAREGLVEARRAVHALREDILPVPQTLSAMLDDPALEVAGTERVLPTAVAQTLVRVLQESITNARRHAPGATVRVRLRYGPSEVDLEIVNGPPPAGTAPGIGDGSGMGLVGMRERAALLHGRVAAEPIVDGPDAGGWRVQVRIPT